MHRLSGGPLRGLLLCGLCFLCGLCAAAQSALPRPKKGGNADAAKLKNPVATTPASLAAGKRSYTRLCVRCHGPEGQGDGTGATGPVPPGDLSDDKWDYGGSDGEIFAVIHDGVSADMEGYAERMSDAEIWNVVNYLRTFAHR
ncbi:MAG: c-type cytochrome [Acidobacteria bacterium]|jgi:mono/diheme cytochrome c family protein|nr:c-type cytochrome [Acidobacteriota bacterium]